MRPAFDNVFRKGLQLTTFLLFLLYTIRIKTLLRYNTYVRVSSDVLMVLNNNTLVKCVQTVFWLAKKYEFYYIKYALTKSRFTQFIEFSNQNIIF